jgi:hypothetical protein
MEDLLDDLLAESGSSWPKHDLHRGVAACLPKPDHKSAQVAAEDGLLLHGPQIK